MRRCEPNRPGPNSTRRCRCRTARTPARRTCPEQRTNGRVERSAHSSEGSLNQHLSCQTQAVAQSTSAHQGRPLNAQRGSTMERLQEAQRAKNARTHNKLEQTWYDPEAQSRQKDWPVAFCAVPSCVRANHTTTQRNSRALSNPGTAQNAVPHTEHGDAESTRTQSVRSLTPHGATRQGQTLHGWHSERRSTSVKRPAHSARIQRKVRHRHARQMSSVLEQHKTPHTIDELAGEGTLTGLARLARGGALLAVERHTVRACKFHNK